MFDSDFDSSDMEISERVDIPDSDDVELLDTSDVQEIIDNMLEEQYDDLSDNESYKATRMTEEQVQAIDALWRSEKNKDIEPYKATRLTEEQMKQTDEIWEEKSLGDIPEPYKAIRFDVADDISTVVGGDTVSDVGSQSLEEQFAAEIDALSFDDLSKEHERLASLSEMDDLDIFAEYDNVQKDKYDPELFNALTDGLPRESLGQLRNGLATGDPNTYEYFGLGRDSSEEDDDSPSLTRKR